MAARSGPVAVGFIEKDKNGDVIWTWTYPSVQKDLKELLIGKCSLSTADDSQDARLCFGKFKGIWYYFSVCSVNGNEKLPWVTDASIVVTSKEFNPELYRAIGSFLLKLYIESGTPVSILEAYLSILTKGFVEDKNDGSILTISDYDQKAAKMKVCLKEIIQMFGMETILIYTALLLKKRVAVFCNKMDTLLHVCRSLPALVWHRQDWDVLFPYSSLDTNEIHDLQSHQSYIAGFIDPTVEERPDLYDVFVNVQDGEVFINPDSKEYFQMGKLHKEIAASLVKAANDEDVTEQAIIKSLMVKTKDIISNLRSLAETSGDETEAKITIEDVHSRNFSAAMQNFLFNLASAENLVKT
eukprot:gene5220-5876_t